MTVWTIVTYALYCCLLAALSLYIYGLRPLDRWRYRHIPGEHGSWFVGNMPAMSAAGMYKYQAQKAKQYGEIYKLSGYQGVEIIITSPALCRQVLLGNVNRPPLPGIKDPSLDRTHPGFNPNHIITANDDRWRSLREAFDPFFLPGSLETYAKRMNACARVTVDRLAPFAGTGELVDIYRGFVDLTMDVIAGVSFGVDLHTQEPSIQAQDVRAQQLQRDAETCFHGFTASKWFLPHSHFPEFSGWIGDIAFMFPDQKLKNFFAAQRRLVDTVTELLKQHREQLAGTGLDIKSSLGKRPSDLVTKAAGSKRRGVATGSFLDLLVRGKNRQTGEPFSDGMIIRQGVAMLLAGYETTAITLTTTMYNLAQHPDIAEKVAQEALSQPEEPTLDSVENMPWTDASIKEALRMYPSAPVGGRQAGEDMILGGYKIKKGTQLKAALYALQRHPDLWERPDDYVPARWVEGTSEAAKRPADAWFAFGGGSRGCPGQRFAMEEAKTALVHLLRTYRFTLGPGQVPLAMRHTMTLSPACGVYVRVERR